MAAELPGPVCILVGGEGRRLGALTAETPKPLVEVAGRPFLFHQLELLRRHGARRVALCVGYRAEMIEQAIGDGSQFDLRVSYSHDGDELVGTAGALRRALPELGEHFMVLYGDTYLPIDYGDAYQAFLRAGLPALMCVWQNFDRYDVSNARYEDGMVVEHRKTGEPGRYTWIDYGLSVLTAEVLGDYPEEQDLSPIFSQLAKRRQLAGYVAQERFYEIGTPEGLKETSAFLTSR